MPLSVESRLIVNQFNLVAMRLVRVSNFHGDLESRQLSESSGRDVPTSPLHEVLAPQLKLSLIAFWAFGGYDVGLILLIRISEFLILIRMI